MTTASLLASIRARLNADDAGHWTMDDSEITKLLQIVEVMQAALDFYSACPEASGMIERVINGGEYIGLGTEARMALLAADKIASND